MMVNVSNLIGVSGSSQTPKLYILVSRFTTFSGKATANSPPQSQWQILLGEVTHNLIQAVSNCNVSFQAERKIVRWRSVRPPVTGS